MKVRLWVSAGAGLALASLCLHTFYRDYSGWFDYDASRPLSPRLELLESTDSYRQYEVRLSSLAGDDIVGLLNLPTRPPPYPLIVLQAGYHRGKDALNLVGDQALHRGYAVFSMDYRYSGSMENAFLAYFEVRGAMRDATIDLRRVLDYFDTRRDIDRDRVVMVGVSLGALFAPILVTVDGRIDYLALVYGGGNVGEVVRANAKTHPILTELLVVLTRLVYAPFEPLRYAPRISPVPLFMVHGTGDDWIPARCAREFYENAGEPKRILWHEHGHVRSFDRVEIARLAGECLAWLDEEFSGGGAGH